MKNHRLSLIVCRMVGALIVAAFASVGAAMAQSSPSDPPPPKNFTISPTGVSLYDLAYLYDVDDLKIGTLTLSRSYMSSIVRSSEYFGEHWTHNFDIWAQDQTIGGNAVSTVVIGRTTYKFNSWSTTPGGGAPENDEVGTTLTNVGGSIVFTDRDGIVYKFTPTSGPQKISTITRPNGEVTSFVYSSGRPVRITSNLGYAIVLEYSGTTNRVVSACGFDLSSTFVSAATTCATAAVKVGYTYALQGVHNNLVTATDVMGNVSNYSYDYTQTDGLTCIRLPGDVACRINNTYAQKLTVNGIPIVVSQVLADGSVWGFDCTCGESAIDDPDNFDPIEYTTVTKPGGKTTDTWFQNGGLFRYYDEAQRLTEFNYFGRILVSVKFPEGNQVTYNTYGNLADNGRTYSAKPGTGLNDIVTGAKTYPASCIPTFCYKPLTVTDSKGNITNITYDATHAGVLSEMQPAPATGTARPLKLYTYVQKSAYVKNSSDALVPSGAPIWMISTVTQCQTVAGSNTPACDMAAPRMQTTYQYGADGTADNLLVRGTEVKDLVTGVKRLTCFAYDTLGRKISQTNPRGTTSISVCP